MSLTPEAEQTKLPQFLRNIELTSNTWAIAFCEECAQIGWPALLHLMENDDWYAKRGADMIIKQHEEYYGHKVEWSRCNGEYGLISRITEANRNQ